MSDDNQKPEENKNDAQALADQAEKAGESAEKADSTTKDAEKSARGVKEIKEEKPMPKVSKKLEDLIKEIEKLSVLELSELVKALEAKFGVSVAAPVPVAAAGAQADTNEGISEQTTFNVILTDGGANKISVIKAVREIVPTLGLKEAKDLVDGAPKPVLEGANKESANEAKQKLEAAGAAVELK